MIDFGWRDPDGKDEVEEELRKERYRKRFDHPIDEARNDKFERARADGTNRGEIELQELLITHTKQVNSEDLDEPTFSQP